MNRLLDRLGAGRSTNRAWVRLDNASNIFLAARSAIDPKVFRLSAELAEIVDPDRLQQALDVTFDQFPLYHATLRKGVFWHYLQASDLRPTVTAEDQPSCAPIYVEDRRSLLFRVMHHERRISLEVFHALSDGIGALGFFSDLLEHYCRPDTQLQPRPSQRASPRPTPGNHLTVDSFAHYFRRRPPKPPDPEFQRAATPAALSLREAVPPEPHQRWRLGRLLRPGDRVHRVRGTRTPDNRTRAVELTMPVVDVLNLARAEGVSLTIYLTALFFEAVRRSAGDLGRSNTMAASIPVNLRQFFPSDSARNFFATVRISHTFGEGVDDIGSIARHLEAQFRPKANPQALERKLRRLIRFERSPMLRIVPRPAKDFLLGLLNHANNRNLTVAASNLGRVTLPGAAEHDVGRMTFQVSAIRPQFCAICHAGRLTLTFTAPFVETSHVREFARILTTEGISVAVAATRVTDEEMAI